MRTEHDVRPHDDWSCAPFTRRVLEADTDRVVCVSRWVRDAITQRVPRLRGP